MISRVEKDKKRPDLRWDPTISKWIGYRADVRSGGKRHRATFPTKKLAEDFVAELRTRQVYTRAGLKSRVSTDLRISVLLEKHRLAIRNPKEQIRAKRVFADFIDAIETDAPVVSIRTMHFQKYINLRSDHGVKPESIYRELNILSAAFKKAEAYFPVELEGYEPPPIARPRYNKQKKTRRDIKEFEKELIIRSILNDRLPREHPVRTRSRPVVAAIFEIAWLLGLRYSEILNLRRTEFDPQRKTLWVTRLKTKAITSFDYLPDRVVEILAAEIGKHPEREFIFDLPCSDHTFADIIKQAVAGNDIPYGRGVIGGVTFHSTRHSFTTRMVQVTDIATAKSFTGHSDDEMVAYYSHASQESRREAMRRLYGSPNDNGNGGGGDKAKEIFDKVRSGKMDLKEFRNAIRRL